MPEERAGVDELLRIVGLERGSHTTEEVAEAERRLAELARTNVDATRTRLRTVGTVVASLGALFLSSSSAVLSVTVAAPFRKDRVAWPKRLRQQGWLVDLDGVGMKAGVIRATTGGLDRLVADGVKAGEISITEKRAAA